MYNFQSAVIRAIENIPARYMYNEGIILFFIQEFYKISKSCDSTHRGKASSQCKAEYLYTDKMRSKSRSRTVA